MTATNWLEETRNQADATGRPTSMPLFAGQKLVVVAASVVLVTPVA
jgi:hypothetical protein